MINNIDIEPTDQWILSHRGHKNKVDAFHPYYYLVEEEADTNGKIVSVATIFLTNKECPFRCLMCDLWKNTTDYIVPDGAIPKQIEWALEHLPQADHIKLYNSGNFFDKKAIPASDYEKIAQLVEGFQKVTIESHPKLIGAETIRFSEMITGQLEVAIGLETVHPGVIEKLNKRMGLEEFAEAVKLLNSNNISSRAFILLRPPFLNEEEGVEWAKKSIDFSFNIGVDRLAVIPTRSGNGALDYLQEQGAFEPPKLQSLEQVLDYGIKLKQGIVTADLWDLEKFSTCQFCFDERKGRMAQINRSQQEVGPIFCKHCQT